MTANVGFGLATWGVPWRRISCGKGFPLVAFDVDEAAMVDVLCDLAHITRPRLS